MIIASYVFGIIGCIFSFVAFLLPSKANTILFICISNIAYSLSLVFLNSMVGAVIIGVAIIRCLYYFYREKKNKPIEVYSLIIFWIINIIITIVFWNNYFDLFAFFGSMFFIFSLWYKDKHQVVYKLVFLFGSILLLLYNVAVSAYANVATEALTIIAILISVFVFLKKRMYK